MSFNKPVTKMNKTKAKKIKKKLLNIKPYYIAGMAMVISALMGAGMLRSPAIALVAYFSWEIFKDDLENYRVLHLNLVGLLAGFVAMAFAGIHFDISIFRSIIFFFIGWGMFQLFEGDIGGGDVRLVTVLAIFMNTVQILSAISLAAAVGMLIGSNLKLKRVPFGALLIVSAWLTFWIVRF